ncbi:MAG: DKNYY domain-containing protein [Cocleimonas sp.]|nr:DKNYY domain-containing protein [Cocleimonas sp.]
MNRLFQILLLILSFALVGCNKVELSSKEANYEGYFERNKKVYLEYSDEGDFLLKGISPKGFDLLSLRDEYYYKDNSGIYSQKKIMGSCSGRSCELKEIIVTKIIHIMGKSLSIYDKHNGIIKIDDDFYLLNKGSIYPVNPDDSRFNDLLKLDHILSSIGKIIYRNDNIELKNVNPNDFKAIGNHYAINAFVDKKHLYIYGRTIDIDFDYRTIKAFQSRLLKDKNGIYVYKFPSSYKIITGSIDIESFKLIGCSNMGCYFKDKNKIYYHWGGMDNFKKLEMQPDLETFEYLGAGLAKDKNNYYTQGRLK